MLNITPVDVLPVCKSIVWLIIYVIIINTPYYGHKNIDTYKNRLTNPRWTLRNICKNDQPL